MLSSDLSPVVDIRIIVSGMFGTRDKKMYKEKKSEERLRISRHLNVVAICKVLERIITFFTERISIRMI